MWQVHNRFAIWNQGQHPFKHALSDFGYANNAMPGVTNVESALNWITSVLYPNTKPAVANVAALPLVGNTLNDYRVVLDDGDGKAASYRWEQREGEVSPSWHKIYDMDWGQDSILAAFQDQTQDLYVWRLGRTDLDGGGIPVAGIFAGQRIFGGNLTGQNLTLDANSADGTGYVQVNNHFRPTQHNSFDLGTPLLKFRSALLGTSLDVATMSLSTGSIVDSTGAINFGSNDLSTTGDITGQNLIAVDEITVNSTLHLAGGQIYEDGGTIDFLGTNLIGIGNLVAATADIADFTFGVGSLTSASATISFGTNNLSTSGTLGAGNATVTRLDADNLRLDANTLSVLNANGNLNLVANGTGVIDFQSAVTSLGISATGNISATGTGQFGNILLNTNSISVTDTNGDLSLFANGTGKIYVASNLLPNANATYSVGDSTYKWTSLFLTTGISDGVNSISMATLLSLKDINVGVTAGMSIFWDGTKWAPSIPDTEVDHTLLTNLTLGDAGHTQFALLAGRAGGQTLIGGTLASQDLIFESTAHVTKGLIKFKDSIVPNATAVYSGGWSGVDLGSASLSFNDIYSKGEHKGLRLENFTTAGLPASSAQNVGRIMWNTDENKLYVDKGTALVAVGTSKYLNDESFDGIQTTKTVTVSGSVADARRAIWALLDNANDYEQIICSIKAISATQVTITTTAALPNGSYRLIGIE